MLVSVKLQEPEPMIDCLHAVLLLLLVSLSNCFLLCLSLLPLYCEGVWIWLQSAIVGASGLGFIQMRPPQTFISAPRGPGSAGHLWSPPLGGSSGRDSRVGCGSLQCAYIASRTFPGVFRPGFSPGGGHEVTFWASTETGTVHRVTPNRR